MMVLVIATDAVETKVEERVVATAEEQTIDKIADILAEETAVFRPIEAAHVKAEKTAVMAPEERAAMAPMERAAVMLEETPDITPEGSSDGTPERSSATVTPDESEESMRNAVLGEIGNICAKVKEREMLLRIKRAEFRNIEVEVELEVYSLKKKVLQLQALLTTHNEDSNIAEDSDLKKLIGKGWRSNVMQLRIYGRLTRSARKEAEEWARQTQRSLVLEMIKKRKHNWISRPRKKSFEKGHESNLDGNTNFFYKESSSGLIEHTEAKIVPTFSFEHIKGQIEAKWRDEIKIKIAEVESNKQKEQNELVSKLEKIHSQMTKDTESVEKEHENVIYALNKGIELLNKMLVSDIHMYEKGFETSIWKTEFECPICFEEMRPPIRIWQCLGRASIKKISFFELKNTLFLSRRGVPL